MIVVIKDLLINFCIVYVKLDVYRLEEFNLHLYFVLHQECELDIFLNSIFMGHLNGVLVKNEVIFVVKSLEFNDSCIAISLSLINSKLTILDEILCKCVPVEKSVYFHEVSHLRACQVMSHRRFKQLLLLIFSVNFLGCGDNFKTWHTNLSLELLLDNSMVFNTLHNADLERG